MQSRLVSGTLAAALLAASAWGCGGGGSGGSTPTGPSSSPPPPATTSPSHGVGGRLVGQHRLPAQPGPRRRR